MTSSVLLFRLLVMLSLAAIVACAVAIWSRARRRLEGRWFLACLVLEALLVVAYIVEHETSSISAAIVWDSVELVLDGGIGTAYLFFALEYIGRPIRRHPLLVALALSSVEVVAGVFAATSPWHHLARVHATMVTEPMRRLDYPFEVFDQLAFAAFYAKALGAVMTIAAAGFVKHHAYRRQAIALTIGVAFPMSTCLPALLNIGWLGERDLSPFMLAIGDVAMTLAVLGAQAFVLVPYARERVLEQLDDGVIVTDERDRIVDVNSAAEALVPAGVDAIGDPLDEVWTTWKELRAEFATSKRVRHVVAGRTWELSRTWLDGAGWLVVARDVTRAVELEKAQAEANEVLERRVQERTAELTREVAERRTAESIARSNEQKFRAIFDNAYQFIGLLDLDGRILEANRSSLEAAHVSAADVIGKPFRDAPWWANAPEEVAKLDAAIAAARGGQFARFDTVHRVPGRSIEVDFSIRPVVADDGRVVMLLPEGRDVTAHRESERERQALLEQTLHDERLEMLGRLAGGVAHDLNNLLMVISGATVFLRMGAPPALLEDIETLEQASESAGALTRQLLLFTRRQSRSVRRVEPSAVVRETSRMLRRLLGERHSLVVDGDATAALVAIDPAELEQCLVNLVVNARDAMPEGGNVHVSITVEKRTSGDASGEWVVLCVRDSGIGMSEAVRRRMFEPFFTTKPSGRGTGIGLATVQRIAKDAGGVVHVESEPGKGTAFHVRLPRVAEEPSVESPAPIVDVTGRESVAIVEDVAAVRTMIARELRRLGYRVMTFPSAEALLSDVAGGAKFDALLSDVILPGLSGPKLVEQLNSRWPELAVVFATGYAGDESVALGERPEGSELLYKPYKPIEAAAAVRRALAAKTKEARSG